MLYGGILLNCCKYEKNICDLVINSIFCLFLFFLGVILFIDFLKVSGVLLFSCGDVVVDKVGVCLVRIV